MKNRGERHERGLAKLGEMNKDQAQKLAENLADIAPGFADYVVDFVFGDIFSRPGLDLRTRELITIAALTALGQTPQLKAHMQLALGAGCSREEIVETVIQMAVYAGFPAALNGLAVAKEVFPPRERK
jgi:4-carboxymuconolactone decarboxylase